MFLIVRSEMIIVIGRKKSYGMGNSSLFAKVVTVLMSFPKEHLILINDVQETGSKKYEESFYLHSDNMSIVILDIS